MTPNLLFSRNLGFSMAKSIIFLGFGGDSMHNTVFWALLPPFLGRFFLLLMANGQYIFWFQVLGNTGRFRIFLALNKPRPKIGQQWFHRGSIWGSIKQHNSFFCVFFMVFLIVFYRIL